MSTVSHRAARLPKPKPPPAERCQFCGEGAEAVIHRREDEQRIPVCLADGRACRELPEVYRWLPKLDPEAGRRQSEPLGGSK